MKRKKMKKEREREENKKNIQNSLFFIVSINFFSPPTTIHFFLGTKGKPKHAPRMFDQGNLFLIKILFTLSPPPFLFLFKKEKEERRKRKKSS